MIAIKAIATILFVVYQMIRIPAVQVPDVKAAAAADEVNRPALVIKVAKDGSLSHQDKKITTKQLADLCKAHKKKHPDGVLNISAHKQASLKHTRVVLDAAAKADLTIVLFDAE